MEETGVSLIAKERDRQINELGFDVANDYLYNRNQLETAAMCYIERLRSRWPWNNTHLNLTPGDRITELKKAGALIAAQIDRELLMLKRK